MKKKRIQWRDTKQTKEERQPATSTCHDGVKCAIARTEELSILLKFDLDHQQTTLFCCTETWLSEDADFHLDGFNIIRFDRDAVRKGSRLGAGSA